jgi:hypothetical protein
MPRCSTQGVPAETSLRGTKGQEASMADDGIVRE